MLAIDTRTWYLMKSQPHWRRSTPPLDVTIGEDYLLVSVSPLRFSRSESTKLTYVLWTWWHGYIRGWWHWWTGWCRSRQKFRQVSATMQRKRNQAIQIEAQTQVHRIVLPGTPCSPKKAWNQNAKIKVVQETTRPDNIKAVRRFCGFVSYLAKLMPKLSEVMEPIRNLTCKENEWK